MSTITQSNLRITGGSDDGGGDRRIEPRAELKRTVKVFQPRARRFLVGRTVNVSDHGMLLELDSPTPMSVGEALDVVIAWDRPAVVRRDQMAPATIVRTERDGRVGLRIGPDVQLAAA